MGNGERACKPCSKISLHQVVCEGVICLAFGVKFAHIQQQLHRCTQNQMNNDTETTNKDLCSIIYIRLARGETTKQEYEILPEIIQCCENIIYAANFGGFGGMWLKIQMNLQIEVGLPKVV